MERILVLDASESLGFRFSKDYTDKYEIMPLSSEHGLYSLLKSIENLNDDFDFVINNFEISYYNRNTDLFDLNFKMQDIINEKFRSAKKIYISTQMVYSSSGDKKSESDKTEPETYYGRTKLMGEAEAKKDNDYIIFRSGLIYGKCIKNIYTDILVSLRGRTPLKLDNSIRINPTLNRDASMAVEAIIKYSDNDVYNLASPDNMTLYDFGRTIAGTLNVDNYYFIKINSSSCYNYDVSSEKIEKTLNFKFSTLNLMNFMTFLR